MLGFAIVIVSVDDVKKTARLAKIKLDDSETEKFRDDLNNILCFVEQLRAVECPDDDGMPAPATAHERVDVVAPCDSKALLDNAPQKEYNMFVVPKVVG